MILKYEWQNYNKYWEETVTFITITIVYKTKKESTL